MKIRRWNSFSRSGSTASQGYLAAAGRPTGGWGDGLMAGLGKVSRHPAGGALALPLLAVGLFLVPQQKRRLVLDALKRAIQEHRRLPQLNGRRLRLPGYGWRAVTLVLIAALLGSDPNLERLWTAQAQNCSVPINLSLEQERITEFAYDFEGRLTQVNSPEGVINYGYEETTGRHIRTCTKNSEVHYGYDELGRLKTVHVTKRNGSSADETTTYTYT
ncbi:MAG TPA: hypothetical protein VN673_01725, partial [Clostridia bacterium]|nr:hypothetical protein [Clostridia bacterium]